jgi:hypothetical protein
MELSPLENYSLQKVGLEKRLIAAEFAPGAFRRGWCLRFLGSPPGP